MPFKLPLKIFRLVSLAQYNTFISFGFGVMLSAEPQVRSRNIYSRPVFTSYSSRFFDSFHSLMVADYVRSSEKLKFFPNDKEIKFFYKADKVCDHCIVERSVTVTA